ncbi:MAG: hydrogenase maturation nickel metallochaperone HypA [Bacteroidales bacterium]|nr:hydrogenase maturation nickel metallochaperone HypA [Bacteroidales bacterium]
MHELSIAVNIVEIAEEEARKHGAGSIHEVELEVGEFSGVVLEALEFALQEAVRETLLEKAEIHIRSIGAWAKCTECKSEFRPAEPLAPCPYCGDPFPKLIRGRELRVSSMKVT